MKSAELACIACKPALFLPLKSAFVIAGGAQGRLGSDELRIAANASYTGRSFYCALFTSGKQLLKRYQSRNSRGRIFDQGQSYVWNRGTKQFSTGDA